MTKTDSPESGNNTILQDSDTESDSPNYNFFFDYAREKAKRRCFFDTDDSNDDIFKLFE